MAEFWVIWTRQVPYTRDEELVSRRFSGEEEARAFQREQDLSWIDSVIVEGKIIEGTRELNEVGEAVG